MKVRALFIFALLFISGCGQLREKYAMNKLDNSEILNTTLVIRATSTNHSYILPVGSMRTSRAAHTTTLLKNRTVLICGGFAGSNTLSSAEFYDPASNVFKSVGQMSVARAGHSATLLPDGKILIAGGYNGNYLSSTEIFDPQSQTFFAGPIMNSPRSGHTATLLNNGKILFAGGVGVGWSFLKSAELYDIQTKTFSTTGAMSTARESHTATLLRNGTVLITGGHNGRRENIKIYSSAEIFDPLLGKFRLVNNMTKIRHKHDAVMLADGRVLITGGSDERDSRGAYSSAEIYEPVSSSFNFVKNMNLTRYKHNGTSILLSNNNVLVAGGANRAEVYNSETGIFTIVSGSMGTQRLFSNATLLSNGQVLITGGYNEKQETSAKVWKYIYKR
jgi:hypothetical protein